ncbi:MAG: sigma-70 family RNA polymerase sigma factor [Planctomycetota bacterium]|jgi:RNA polymerase sigma-70 factor (ECF subfamily)
MSNSSGVSITAQIERARHEGDASSLLQAYRNYLRFIARDGVGVALRSKVDVSDVAQDVLIRARERFEQFRGGTEKELLGWLRRILANHIVDLTRKYHVGGGRNLVQEQSIEEVLYESAQAFGQVLALSGTSPSQHAVRSERDALVADALAELSADHEEVIKLRTMQGLRWEEVARRMGRSDGAVRKLWFRALQVLRPALEKKL